MWNLLFLTLILLLGAGLEVGGASDEGDTVSGGGGDGSNAAVLKELGVEIKKKGETKSTFPLWYPTLNGFSLPPPPLLRHLLLWF